MHEGLFFAGFIVVLSIALFFAGFPLSKKERWVILPLFGIIAVGFYALWGSFMPWHLYEAKRRDLEMVKAELARFKSPQELAIKLRARLREDKASARGWYLLGRLYAGQGNWEEARLAFATAFRLNPQDEPTQINYILSLWETNQRHFNAPIRSLLAAVLQNNPTQPDALALTGQDAFEQKDYKKAGDCWRTLLKGAPEDSEQAIFLRKAIARLPG